MLFHALSGGVPGEDIEQIVAELAEPFDREAFRTAWMDIVHAHEPLRTRFVWRDVERPVQVVEEVGPLDIRYLDWSGLSGIEQERRFDVLLGTDRREQFDLARMPLSRVTVVELDTERWSFVWTFHHILLDGRSFPQVLSDLFDAYEVRRAGRSPELAARPQQRDFIDWLERKDTTSERFWRDNLAGFASPTPLPLAGLLPAVPVAEVEAVESTLSAEATGALARFATTHGLTLNTLVQGAWGLLLHHYTGESDIVFGATRACRRSVDPRVAEATGLLINTLPVRLRVRPDDDAIGYLQRARELHVSLREHEHTPLASVRRWSELAPGRPLFETLVVYEHGTLDAQLRARGGAWLGRRFRYLGQTNFPLALIAYGGEGLLLRLEYRTDLLDESLAMQVLRHVAVLLDGLTETPSARLSEVTCLTPEELAAPGLVRTRTFPVTEPVHTLFERNAANHPDAVAVSYADEHVSYAELNRRADRLAVHLRALGVERDVLVGLLVERSLDMVVAILGVLKAGGAYVPIDPAYPAERIRYILDDARARVLVTQRVLLDRIPEHASTTALLEDASRWHAGSPPTEWTPPDPDSLAYVIYTSGSTGRPKGVLVTHANVVRLLRSTETWFDFGPRDVWTLFHSYAFDFSVWELWGALAYGGRVVVVPYVVSRSPETFLELLVREGVTVLNQTPSAFMQLAPVAVAGARPALALRWVVFGGEALDPKNLRPWARRFGYASPRLVNMYGITETTVHVTYRLLDETDIQTGSRSVIGEPLPDLKLLVLDRHGRPAPVGVAGELHVGGAGLARGYLDRPELTAERFIPDPDNPSSRLYRTGDLARRLPDGDHEYLGRRDDQVKIRGFRIELGEVEGYLSEAPQVAHATVVVREDEPGRPRLVGYYVPRSPGSVGTDLELREWLAERLPDHMVPSVLVPMSALPLTAHGKVDRRALPAPPSERARTQAHVAPRNDVESRLAGVWRDVLGLSQVSMDDDFFALGGDSIISIQIVSRARALGLQLRAGDVLLHPTISELAAVAVSATAPRPAARARGDVPLTPIQSWFFALDVPNVNHWNQWLCLPLRPDADATSLEAALRDVVEHHDAFRLRFVPGPDGWRQMLTEDVLPFRLERRRAGPSGLSALIDEAQTDLDLRHGPVLRALIVDTDGDSSLVLVAHHLVIDGVSWRILLEDVVVAHSARLAGRRPELSGGTTWAEWGAALDNRRRDPEVVAERPFWLGLTAASAIALPEASAGPGKESSARVAHGRLDGPTTTALLQDIHRAYGTRTNEVLLTAFALVLRDASGSSEVCIDLEGHGREVIDPDLDLSRTIGWFTTIFPALLALPDGHDLGETLVAVRDQVRAIPHNGIGYGLLFPAEPAGNGPRRNVVFNYLGQTDRLAPPSDLFAATGGSIGASHDPESARPYELEVIAEVVDGCLTTRWIHSEAAHSRETVEALAAAFDRTVARLVEHCKTALRTRPIPAHYPRAQLTQPELDQLLASYPDAVDVCRLTPMQELYLGVSTADPSLGYEQWQFRIEGPIDEQRLRDAWNWAINRRDVLRSAYVANRLTRPHRVVVAPVDVPWTRIEIGEGAAATEQLAHILRADEALGIDISRPPLARLMLIRRGAELHDLVWGTHHLSIDGWSWPLVLADVTASYRDPKVQGTSAPPAGFGEFVEWLSVASHEGERAFWTSALAGFTGPLRLRGDDRNAPAAAATVELSVSETEALVDAARTLRVTLGTFVQGAWAMVLSGWTGSDDVVFGAAFSGRPAELPGAGQIVGPFVNNLPVRARIAPGDEIGNWLSSFQRYQVEISRFQHTPLQRIHEWSDISPRDRLFESLVVVQNYVVDRSGFELGPGTRMTCIAAPQSTNYPLTVVATPGDRLRVEVASRSSGWSVASVTRLAEAMTRTLVDMGTRPQAPCKEFRRPLALARAPAVTPDASAPTPAPGANALERVIVAAFTDAFGGAAIGLYDNFFDLGAHSLLLLSVHERLQAELGRTFPVTDVFEFATVAALAEHLGSASAERVRAFDQLEDRARGMRERLERARRRANVNRGRADE